MYLQKNTTSSKAWSTVSSTNASEAGAFFWGMAGSFHSIVTLYSTITRKKIQDATGEKLSTFYLFQSISMAIQKGNAVCVVGCPKDTFSGLEGLFNFHVPNTYLSYYLKSE